MQGTLRAPTSPLDYAAQAVTAVKEAVSGAMIATMLALGLLAAPLAATATPAFENTLAADVGDTMTTSMVTVGDALVPDAIAAAATDFADDVAATTEKAFGSEAAFAGPIGNSLMLVALLAGIAMHATRTRRPDGYIDNIGRASLAMHFASRRRRLRGNEQCAMGSGRDPGSGNGFNGSRFGDNSTIGGFRDSGATAHVMTGGKQGFTGDVLDGSLAAMTPATTTYDGLRGADSMTASGSQNAALLVASGSPHGSGATLLTASRSDVSPAGSGLGFTGTSGIFIS